MTTPPNPSQKLNPARFPGMSPLMAAVVGYVLGESFTEPTIAELAVSEQENLAYIRQEGAIGFEGIQSLEDLRSNWNDFSMQRGSRPRNGRRRCGCSMREFRSFRGQSSECQGTSRLEGWRDSCCVYHRYVFYS